jgi:hypothetical protein
VPKPQRLEESGLFALEVPGHRHFNGLALNGASILLIFWAMRKTPPEMTQVWAIHDFA